MDLGLKDKTAVISGADSGIGATTARLFLQEGARMVIADKIPDEIERAVGELKAFGEIHGTVVDVTKPDSVDALAASRSTSSATSTI